MTEVNECAICSYAHTKRALETGMTNDEIQDMLNGIMDNVPAEEVAGVMLPSTMLTPGEILPKRLGSGLWRYLVCPGHRVFWGLSA